MIVAAAKVKTFEGYSLLFPTVGTDRLPVSIVAFPPWEIMQTRHQPNANNYIIVSVFAVASNSVSSTLLSLVTFLFSGSIAVVTAK